ncbi:MAG: hypothetical protein ABL888_06295 [Pirellulaceae bacterium]
MNNFRQERLMANQNSPDASPNFSLRQLFFVVTLAAVYLGFVQVSPAFANLILIVVGPAFARTIIAEELLQKQNQQFPWAMRLKVLICSIGLMISALLIAATTFVLVSMLFGLIASLFGVAIAMSEFWFENAVLGSLGGMVIGSGVAFIAFAVFLYHRWPLRLIEESKSDHRLNG